uniref:Uncharacterized protein n=1 Tax=viral metagenome TaxID=1070528 RepID=A0A6H1ZUB1_9ZZZZ
MKEFVREISWKSIESLIINYHYLHRMPAGILACYGLYEQEDSLCPIGAIVYCNGRIQYQNKFIEFSRMYLYDEIPKNTESYFIAKTLKMLQKKFPSFEGVVTWADENIGHKGTVYVASNFVFDGMSRVTKKFKSNTGKTVYQRTVIDENQYKLLNPDKPKLRFKYYFDKKKREEMRNTIR